ncbi:MAG: phage major capsid protein [Candidatus Woesearchaeota archaeon]
MTLEQYKAKRRELINKAEDELDKGNLDEYENIESKIEKLDNEFDDHAKKIANKRALNNLNGSKGHEFISGKLSEAKTILNKGDSWEEEVKADQTGVQNFNLGKILKGMATGDWKNAQAEFNNITTSTTGTLIPEVLSARVLDKAREKSLFTQAGVPIIPMESGNVTVGKVLTDPVMEFKEEGAAASESSMELGGVKLESKTAYGWAYITLEALQSAKNLQEVAMNAFSGALSQVIDKAFLYGQSDGSGGFDSFAPAGIFNNEDIESVTAADPVVDYDGVIKAVSKVKQNNGLPTSWGINSKTEEIYSLLKNANGDYYLEAPRMVRNLNQIVSNQLVHEETDGSKSLIFDPKAMAIGMQNRVSIKLIEGTDEGLEKGKVALRIYAMLDAKLLRPEHVCELTGIKE